MQAWMFAGVMGVAVLVLGPTVAEAGPIRHRENRQAVRIEQGVQNGSLTAAETRVLRREQGGIEEFRQGALTDGRVGPGEGRILTRAQNRANRHIYRLKHNDRVADTD